MALMTTQARCQVKVLRDGHFRNRRRLEKEAEGDRFDVSGTRRLKSLQPISFRYDARRPEERREQGPALTFPRSASDGRLVASIVRSSAVSAKRTSPTVRRPNDAAKIGATMTRNEAFVETEHLARDVLGAHAVLQVRPGCARTFYARATAATVIIDGPIAAYEQAALLGLRDRLRERMRAPRLTRHDSPAAGSP
jgi:hypothetical protein